MSLSEGEPTFFYGDFASTPSPVTTATRNARPMVQTQHHEEHLRENAVLQQTLAARIQDLGNRITTAEQLARDAAVEKRVLEAQLQALAASAAAFSPVRTLPQELLGEIFKHLVDLDRRPRPFYDSEFTAAARVFGVSSVCRSWRAAAIATPRLWARLELSFGVLSDPRKQVRDAWLLYMRIHLDRARAHPLVINVDKFHPDYIAGPDVHDALRTLLRALPRCRKFALVAYFFGESSQYLPLHFQKPTPLLEEFVLFQRGSDADTGVERRFAAHAHFLPHAPRLRNLVLDAAVLRCVTFSQLPALVDLLLCAHDTKVDPVALVRMLQQCPQLVVLCVGPKHSAADGAQLSALPALMLPALTQLRSDSSLAWAGDIAPLLTCPALRTLDAGSYGGLPAEHRAVASLGAHVTSLELQHLRGALVPLLRALPQLQELQAAHVVLFAADLAQLADARPWVAPRLQDMCFDCIVRHDEDAPMQLLRFVESRTEPLAEESDKPCLLRTVVLSTPRGDRHAVSDPFPDWVQDTVDRYLRHCVPDRPK